MFWVAFLGLFTTSMLVVCITAFYISMVTVPEKTAFTRLETIVNWSFGVSIGLALVGIVALLIDFLYSL